MGLLLAMARQRAYAADGTKKHSTEAYPISVLPVWRVWIHKYGRGIQGLWMPLFAECGQIVQSFLGRDWEAIEGMERALQKNNQGGE